MAFDPRAIPGRDHHDRIQTWTISVLSRMSGEKLADFQKNLTESTGEAVRGDDDYEKVRSVLAELGFCAVIDRMAEIIEESRDE